MPVRIAGTGAYLPARIVTNRQLAEQIDTSDEWIQERTGIKQRHIAGDDEVCSDLALHASRNALSAA
jgi:3-oxoacyl-[acyl-carrier-protein] synthase-3